MKGCRKATLKLDTQELLTSFLFNKSFTATLEPSGNLITNRRAKVLHDSVPSPVVQIRGPARDALKKKVMEISVEQLTQEQSRMLADFNSDNSKDESCLLVGSVVAQKARSEKLKTQDLAVDSIEDLILFKAASDKAKQRIISSIEVFPIRIVLIPIDQWIQLKDKIEHDELIVEFDASGGFCSNPFSDPNKPLKSNFVYSGVIGLKPNTLSKHDENHHLFGMISTAHDQISIGKLFGEVKMTSISIMGLWPLFRYLVTDWSWAIINGGMIGLNGFDILEYLEYAERVTNGFEEPNEEIIEFSLCQTHLTKTISADISKLELSNEAKFDLIRIITALTETTTKDSTYQLLEHILIMLTTERLGQDALTSRLFVNACCATTAGETPVTVEISNSQKVLSDEDAALSDEEHTKSEARYMKSPFFKKGTSILLKVQSKNYEDPTAPTNPLYSPEFAELLIKKYVAYAPLLIPWIYAIRNGGKFIRFNSGRIEGSWNRFRQNLKQQQLAIGAAPVKISRFVKQIFIPMNECAIAWFLSKLNKRTTNFLKKGVEKREPLPVEGWRKKSKVNATRPHFDPREITSHLPRKLPSPCKQASYPLIDGPIVYANGLVQEPHHYELVLDTSRVARFKNQSGDGFTLFGESFKTILGSNELNSDCIFYFCSLILSHLNAENTNKIVHPSDSEIIFQLKSYIGRPQEWSGWKIFDDQVEQIFFPVNVASTTQRHWILIVVDTNSRTVVVIDPLKPNQMRRATEDLSKVKECLSDFLKAINKKNNSKHKTSYVAAKPMAQLPVQQDSFNCGVLIIRYISMYIKKSNDFETSIPLYRRSLALLCIESSENMKNYCIECDSFLDSGECILDCSICHRSAHKSCTNKDAFQCFLCIKKIYSGKLLIINENT